MPTATPTNSSITSLREEGGSKKKINVRSKDENKNKIKDNANTVLSLVLLLVQLEI